MSPAAAWGWTWCGRGSRACGAPSTWSAKPGAGTSVTLRLPLTLAIIDGLLVSVGGACFVLPLASVLECIELTRQDIEQANGKHVVNVRGEIVPYIRLREHFNIRTERPELEQIMIVETEEGRYGLVVDKVLGDCQTVIKNLGRFYRHVQVVSGATILGNGTVALILDPDRLVQDALRLQVCRETRGGKRFGRPAGRAAEESSFVIRRRWTESQRPLSTIQQRSFVLFVSRA